MSFWWDVEEEDCYCSDWELGTDLEDIMLQYKEAVRNTVDDSEE